MQLRAADRADSLWDFPANLSHCRQTEESILTGASKGCLTGFEKLQYGSIEFQSSQIKFYF